MKNEYKRLMVAIDPSPLGGHKYLIGEYTAASVGKDVSLPDALREMADFLEAPSQKVTGECEECYDFILEGEEHICK